MEENKIDTSFTDNLVQLYQNFTGRVGDTFELAVLEMRLAKRSLMIIALSVLIIGFLLAFTWTCGMSILAIQLVAYGFTWTMSLSLVGILNLLLITLLAIACLKLKNNLKFNQTRKQLNFSRDENHGSEAKH
jgi:hypothetical protein